MRASHHPPDAALRHAADLRISIHGDGGCWFLECAPLFQRLMFSSAKAAEEAGRTLAKRFTSTGHEVRLAIEDRPRQSTSETRSFLPLPGTVPELPEAPDVGETQ